MTRLEEHLVVALKQHLETRQPVRLPAGGDLIWQWFCELSAGRSWHMSGPNPISWSDIAAYGRVMRVPLQSHHISILMAMDAAFIEHLSTFPQSSGKAPPVSSRPIDANTFDSLFG